MPRGVRGGLNAAQVRERNARIWTMRCEGWTEQMIADEIGLTQSRVSQLLKDMTAARGEPERAALRQIAADKLDAMERAALGVLRAKHVVVRGDGVVKRGVVDAETGLPIRDPETGELAEVDLEDDAPVLAAIAHMLRIEERRAKMFGYDAATVVENRNYDYTVNGLAPEDLK